MSSGNAASEDSSKPQHHFGFTISDTDCQKIWENVSGFVLDNLQKQKAVTIPQLGTFTFAQSQLDVGNNKYVLMQRPVFVMNERLVQSHQLKQTRTHTPGSIPVLTLNYSQLMARCGGEFHRDRIENCVREMISALNRSIESNHSSELVFAGIGRLQIKHAHIKFKFYKSFVSGLDNSDKVQKLMQNRPGTADSVMSERPPSRAFSVSMPLPKINQSLNSMPTIMETSPRFSNETEQVSGEQCIKDGDDSNVLNVEFGEEAGGTSAMPRIGDGEMDLEDEADRILDKIQQHMSGGAADQEASDPQLATDNDNNINSLPAQPLVQIPQPNQVFLNGNTALTPPRPPPSSTTSSASSKGGAALAGGGSTTRSSIAGSATPKCTNAAAGSGGAAGNASSLHRLDLQNAGLAVPPAGTHTNSEGLTAGARERRSSRRSSSCSHISQRSAGGAGAGGEGLSGGQELCYLCHQRERRNVPVSFEQEIKKRDLEEERKMISYNNMQNAEFMKKYQEDLLARRHDNQKISAFNLGVAEATKERNNYRDPNSYSSFVFRNRPLTPSRIHKYQQQSKDLNKQINFKENKHRQQKEEEDFLERMEQAKLADDLAAHRQHYSKQRAEQREQLVHALDTQVRNKPMEIPARLPDSSNDLFAKNDMTEEKLLARREKAREVQADLLATMNQKKRDTILTRLHDQQHEEDVLKSTKENLMMDRSRRYQRHVENRKRLESDWMTCAQEKRERDLVDKLQMSMPNEKLSHELCDKYSRCQQCKRRLHNKGESNIWKETFFIPGSRYIY